MIDGKRYGVNDLDQLPDSLHPFEVSTKSNEGTLGFFGELCKFSNFYPINFTFNGATYHSSEQLIQHQKVLYCNDYDAVNKIMLTKSTLAASNCPTLLTTMIIKGGLMQPMNDVVKGLEPNSPKIHPCCASFSLQATNYW